LISNFGNYPFLEISAMNPTPPPYSSARIPKHLPWIVPRPPILSTNHPI
jgi:hypothetical protein